MEGNECGTENHSQAEPTALALVNMVFLSNKEDN